MSEKNRVSRDWLDLEESFRKLLFLEDTSDQYLRVMLLQVFVKVEEDANARVSKLDFSAPLSGRLNGCGHPAYWAL